MRREAVTGSEGKVCTQAMSGVVQVKMLGRFGNQCMQYLFARAHAERVGARFYCEEWVGEQVFNIPKHGRYDYSGKYGAAELPVRSELDLGPDETDVCIRGYAQNPHAMIYTKEWAREVLKLKIPPEVVFSDPGPERGVAVIQTVSNDKVVAHHRAGDYYGYGYPVVSLLSIGAEAERIWPKAHLSVLSEEHPTPHGRLPSHLSFLPDFYRMVMAPCLMRANSTFSWVAALLNRSGRVFSPVIDGKEGGREHYCTFVEGNWPRLSNLEGCGELRLKGET